MNNEKIVEEISPHQHTRKATQFVDSRAFHFHDDRPSERIEVERERGEFSGHICEERLNAVYVDTHQT